MKNSTSTRVCAASAPVPCSLLPYDLLYNPTSGDVHWWSNSASCTIWQGKGKERKVANCGDPGTASLICRLQWAAIKAANARCAANAPQAALSTVAEEDRGS